jgi:predicted lipoprotein with Yx(FWY)xxD motif
MKPIATIAMTALLLPTAALSQPAKIGSTPTGPALQTPAGKTLYVFDQDQAGSGKSACNKSCAALWPPYEDNDNAKTSADWSLIRRADGSKQWAYKGRPLYTWAKDEGPGQTSGNAFEGNKWHVAKP